MTSSSFTISTAWDGTTDHLVWHWRPLALIGLATIGVNDTLATLLQPVIQGDGGNEVKIAAFVAMIAGALWSIAGQLAITALVLDPDRSMATGLGIGARRLPTMIAATLIVALLGVLAAAPLIWAMIAGDIDLQAQPPVLPGWAAASILALMVAAIAIWARLLLMAPMIVEGAGPLGAIRGSFARTRGAFWRIFGLTLLYFVVSAVVTLAVGTASGAVAGLIARQAATHVGAVASGVATALLSMVLLVFVAQVHRMIPGGNTLRDR